MRLIIDIGNTRIKAVLFKKGKVFKLIHFKESQFADQIDKLATNYPVKHTLVSAVGKLSKKNRNLLRNSFDCVFLNHKTVLNFKNNYATPKTLGVDRIALASAAVGQFPKQNVLVIDAGTCITYDFVTSKATYLGGAISPGVNSRYKSLHDYTENLPSLKVNIPKSFIGDSTEESIHSGVVNGICREIDGVISQYLATYRKLTIVLTGGDAKFLSSQLKSSIFVAPFFLVEGLHTILINNI